MNAAQFYKTSNYQDFIQGIFKLVIYNETLYLKNGKKDLQKQKQYAINIYEIIMQSQKQQPRLQCQQQKLISVCKLIDKPKQLIDKQTINKLYPQNWQVAAATSVQPNKTLSPSRKIITSLNNTTQTQNTRMSCSIILRSGGNKSPQKKSGEHLHCHTEMQIKNIYKGGPRIRNSKYITQDEKLTLVELQDSGYFGQLVYERATGKKNWNWPIKTENYFNLLQSSNKESDDNVSTVVFDSRFQSGNLERVYQSHGNSSNNTPLYTLTTQNDTNTLGYNQWFYFRAKSAKAFQSIRFQIVNMRKNFSSFNKGMKIAIYSQHKWKEEKIGWHRAGADIDYSCNEIRAFSNCNQFLYTLGWNYTFEVKDSWVYFAYSYPYTYSQLKQLIIKTKKHKNDGQWLQVGLSSLKNPIYMLKVKKRQENKYTEQQSENLHISKQLSPQKGRKMQTQKQIDKTESSFANIETKSKQLRDSINKRLKNRFKSFNHDTLNLNLNDKHCQFISSSAHNSPQKKFHSNTSFMKKYLQTKNQRQIQQNRLVKQQKRNQTIQSNQPNLNSNSKKINFSKYLKDSKNKSIKSDKNEKLGQKQLLIIMARAHPGQTPSSFVIQGVINSLLKQSQHNTQIRYLKQKLQIYVIPMINPDGVIHGNTRTSLTGNDLNRRWSNPHPALHPEIKHIKQYFQKLVDKGNKIFALIDLHGHTKKQSAFFYGCCDRKNYHNHAQVKLLNSLMAKAQHNFNPIFSSHYVGQSKRSTARVTFYKQFNCYSYTLQSSFLGQAQSSVHFSVSDYFNIGKNLLKSLTFFYAATKGKAKFKQLINKSLASSTALKQLVLQHFEREGRQQNQRTREKIFDQSQKDSQGSSSKPSQCNYNQQFLIQNLLQNDGQVNGESRYRTRSHSKVTAGRRNMSMSITDKQSLSLLYQSPIKDNNTLKSSLKKTKLNIMLKTKKLDTSDNINGSKLPLINFQAKQQEEVYQFHAFNFKSKKGGARRKKVPGLVSDSTID